MRGQTNSFRWAAPCITTLDSFRHLRKFFRLSTSTGAPFDEELSHREDREGHEVRIKKRAWILKKWFSSFVLFLLLSLRVFAACANFMTSVLYGCSIRRQIFQPRRSRRSRSSDKGKGIDFEKGSFLPSCSSCASWSTFVFFGCGVAALCSLWFRPYSQGCSWAAFVPAIFPATKHSVILPASR